MKKQKPLYVYPSAEILHLGASELLATSTSDKTGSVSAGSVGHHKTYDTSPISIDHIGRFAADDEQELDNSREVTRGF